MQLNALTANLSGRAKRSVGLRALVSAFVLAALALLASWNAFAPIDERVREWRQAEAPREPSGSIVMVDIDAKSLAELGRWPWPRSVHADILDRLLADGADSVVFDVDFTAPTIEIEDAAFERALAASDGRAALTTFTNELKRPGRVEPAMRQIAAPLARLRNRAWNVGADRTAAAREPERFTTTVEVDGVHLPTIAAHIAGVTARQASNIDFSIDPFALPRVSFADVLADRVDGSLFVSRTVVIGTTAAELRRDVVVPVHGTLAEAERHVLAAETILQDRISAGVDWRLIALAAFGIAAVFSMFNVWRAPSWLIVACGLTMVVAIEATGFRLQADAAIALASAALVLQIIIETCASLAVQVRQRRQREIETSAVASNTAAMFDRVVEDNVAGIIVMDTEGNVRRINRVAATLAVVDRASLGERPALSAVFPAFISDPIRAELESQDWTDLKPRSGLFEFVADDGAPRFIEYSLTPTQVVNPRAHRPTQLVAMTFSDVTAREGERRELAYHAEHDPLTGLRNRFAFMRHMDTMGTPRQARAAFLFDVDRFRFHNDVNGTETGDDIIRTVALRASECVHENDFLARLAGDQFVLIAERPDWTTLEQLAENILAAIRSPIRRGALCLDVTASIGMDLIEPYATAGALLTQLDIALTQAKSQGGDRAVRFAARLAEEKIRRRSLETALPQAIAKRQLTLAYQPQVDIETGRVTGAEALVRWTTQDLGFISPNGVHSDRGAHRRYPGLG